MAKTKTIIKNTDYLKPIHKVCKLCGKEFESIWSRRLYCNQQCYLKALSIRSSEYRKKGLYLPKVETHRKWKLKMRKEALDILGGKCVRCGFSDRRALQIDHINGDGHKERGIRKSVCTKIVKGLVEPGKYQLLCANCNWIKRVENNEY